MLKRKYFIKIKLKIYISDKIYDFIKMQYEHNTMQNEMQHSITCKNYIRFCKIIKNFSAAFGWHYFSGAVRCAPYALS